MNASKKNLPLTNGWILCPSKSFPGKFYYFNVLNGEAAWSLKEADNKVLHRDTDIHKIADKTHNYPEPTTLPDDTSTFTPNIASNFRKPDFQTNIPYNQHLPMFGQTSLPKYVTNVEPLIPNIFWTPIQLPIPMFCQETKKPMIDVVTQTSGIEREIFIQTCDIPLCKRFRNYENTSLCFDKKNKIMDKLRSNFETSTPMKHSFFNIKPETGIPNSKSLVKEPVLELDTKSPISKVPDTANNKANLTLITANKVENTEAENAVPNMVQKEEVLDNLDHTDLRFLLLAKRRKSIDATVDGMVQCKKPRHGDLPTTPKKVTFDLTNVPYEDTVTSEENMQEDDFMSLTPKSQSVLHLKQEQNTPFPCAKNDTYQGVPNTPLTLCTKNGTYRESPLSPLSPCPRYDTYQEALMSPPSPCAKNDTHIDTAQNLRMPYVNKEHNLSMPCAKNGNWYIVVDTDVLLLDYKFIDKLALSDPKCKMVIPHVVRVDIEALCIGDCRGQQRVINARQLTRTLATPPAHFIMEPAPDDDNNILVTTDSILNCCVQVVNENRNVVLITNDPHLQSKANHLNIPSYRLNEIKNGVCIKPSTTSELKKIKISISNDLDIVKQQLFLNREDSNILDCDKLINITKSKSQKINNNFDFDTADISREVQNLNLKDKKILKQQNEIKNPFVFQNVINKTNINEDLINFEKKILNPKAIVNEINFGKVNPNSKIIDKSIQEPNIEIKNLQNVLEQNIQSTEKLYCSIPISNIKQTDFHKKIDLEKKSDAQPKILENSGRPVDTKIPNMTLPRDPPNGLNRGTRAITAPQNRIKNMLNTINCDSTKTQEKFEKSNDTIGLFKIPQPLQFKNKTRTSALIDSPIINDKIRTREFRTIDSVEENLKRFCIKSKTMNEKICTRMDEWMCTYMQIMEEVLNDLLQKNSECMKYTVAPLTLYEKLNCIKMLYGSHTNVRDAVDNVSKFLSKCTFRKGNLKPYVRSDDFMKVLGYGVILVQTLKDIQSSEDLSDAESCLNYLLHTLESSAIELGPELLGPNVSCSEICNTDEIRPNFVKDPSNITSYLKKHFKEWVSYNEVTNCQNNSNKSLNQSDFTVLRTFGKNLNMLKIDSSKTISLTKMATEDDPAPQTKEPKLIRQLENQPFINQKENNVKEILEKKETWLNKSTNIFLNEQNNKTDLQNLTKENKIIIDNRQEKDVLKVMKPVEMINQNPKKDTKVIDDLDFPTHGNTFSQNDAISGPKIIRNIKLIDKYEKKIQNKEPLDLDLLDYSEIYEPSVNEYSDSLQFDGVCDKTGSNTDNYEYYNTKCTENFTEDIQLDPDENFETSEQNNYDSNNENYTFSTSDCDTVNNIIINKENITKNNNIYESFDITDNNTVINVSINHNHTKTDCVIENNKYNNNHASRNDNNANDNDNSETHNDNFEKTAQLVRDDSTNDSGFENDSTYAHTVVKVFLKELSTSFKVIYEFVNKFAIEIRGKEINSIRINIVHDQASKSLEDMVAIIQQLRSIIKREESEETALKTLLLKAGVEATTDKKMTRYRQIVMKSLEQAQILENALKMIVSTTVGDFDALSTNAESISSSIRYFNIFE